MSQPAQSPSTTRTMLEVAGKSYFPIALAARFPFAMMVVGVLTLVAAARDSIAFAGISSAVVGIGSAVVGPLVGAAADRIGQRPVLVASAVVNSLSLLALAAVSFSDLPSAVVLVTAFLIGASSPQVAPMSRSRLVGLIRRGVPVRRRAKVTSSIMAFESAVDEIVFVFGPVIVGLLATLMSPAAPIIAAAILTAVFVTMFAVHSSSDVIVRDDQDAPIASASRLIAPEIVVVVVGSIGIGLFFGTTLTSLTALVELLGREGSAGLLYGIMGIGSTILALSVAAFPVRFSLGARWLTFAATLLAGMVVYANVSSLSGVVIALVIAGIGVGPTVVTLWSLGAERSPEGRSATTMTMLGSGIIIGQSAGAATAGEVAESVGLQAAMWLPAVAGALLALAAFANVLIRSRSIRGPEASLPTTS